MLCPPPPPPQCVPLHQHNPGSAPDKYWTPVINIVHWPLTIDLPTRWSVSAASVHAPRSSACSVSPRPSTASASRSRCGWFESCAAPSWSASAVAGWHSTSSWSRMIRAEVWNLHFKFKSLYCRTHCLKILCLWGSFGNERMAFTFIVVITVFLPSTFVELSNILQQRRIYLE